jgi:tripeptidyl-peptidase-1
LDIQYILATGVGVPADFWLDGKNSFDLLGWAAYVQGLSDPALVWSMSYGEGVNGGNGGVIPPSQVQALDTQVMKLGVRGISVLIASGDSGVYDRLPFEHGHFHPSYPACLPSVTAVGATQLNDDGTEDTAVSFSGGGFTPSNYFSRANNASWQGVAVDAYLSSGVKLPPKKMWDQQGRAIPDVSAAGVDFLVFTGGHGQGVSGTSASTPVVAGVFALLNDQRLAAGMPPLGFLNPFIYANPHAFRDITKGYNDGGGIKLLKKGFYATKGWDPVTGLGTPLYPLLKEAALRKP